MIPTYLTFLAVIFITFFITKKSKIWKIARHKEALQQTQEEQIEKIGRFRLIYEVLRMLYDGKTEGIAFYEMAQRKISQFGNVIGFKLPFQSTEYQLVGDPAYARQIMSDPSWPDRVPTGYCIHDAAFYKPYGLLFGGGKYWKAASRVTLKLFHQLGFLNATTMETRALFEMEELERKFDDNLARNCGEHTFCPRDIFGRVSMNVVLDILLGNRRSCDEAFRAKLITETAEMNKKLAAFASIIHIVSYLGYLAKLAFRKNSNETSNMTYDVWREIIEDRRREGKYREHVGDFVGGLLQQVDKHEFIEDNGLNVDNMLVVLRDMLIAGSHTTSATLEHAFLFMSRHPKIQRKVQDEIDGIIGRDRVPSYKDQRRMPFTEATLHEIYRVGCTIPLTSRAMNIGNKPSVAAISLYAIQRNECFFDEPNEFKPERFLDTEDSTKVVNTENLMPFGYGQRSCPAETAARVTVFVYFVGMLQKYWIRPSPHHPQPAMRNGHGISRSPKRYYITIRRRE